jgi:hypothetical protein
MQARWATKLLLSCHCLSVGWMGVAPVKDLQSRPSTDDIDKTSI